MGSVVIGRDDELAILDACLCSEMPEFLAIYGRRRVGKTYLIRQFFAEKPVVFFDVTGAKDIGMKEQIRHFQQQIQQVFYPDRRRPFAAGGNWDDTLSLLTEAMAGVDPHQKIILFLDEFPWLVTKNSKLLQCLDYYWNQHWSKDARIKLIICGSSASWIIEKIVNNRGGLHNRLTRSICLEPFNLLQTKQFLRYLSVQLNDQQILQLYMVMGGVPFYLMKVAKNLSATQNIEALAFKKKSFLLGEFDNLYLSLFNHAEVCVEIVRAIAACRYGVAQSDLLRRIGPAVQGKGGAMRLKALQDANFILAFTPHFHKTRGIYYRVIDAYTLFYFHWIEPVRRSLLTKSLLTGYWQKVSRTPAWHAWAGLAFESICYEHLPQITLALGLSPTSIPSTWRYVPKRSGEQGAQIDLLFDRDDGAITVCEIKYTEKPFAITKAYAQALLHRVEVFKRVTRTSKQIFIAIIAANGVRHNQYADELLSGVVTLDDLFK